MPHTPMHAVRAAHAISIRGAETAKVKPDAAARQYTSDDPADTYPAPAALTARSRWMSGRNNPYANRTSPYVAAMKHVPSAITAVLRVSTNENDRFTLVSLG